MGWWRESSGSWDQSFARRAKLIAPTAKSPVRLVPHRLFRQGLGSIDRFPAQRNDHHPARQAAKHGGHQGNQDGSRIKQADCRDRDESGQQPAERRKSTDRNTIPPLAGSPHCDRYDESEQHRGDGPKECHQPARDQPIKHNDQQPGDQARAENLLRIAGGKRSGKKNPKGDDAEQRAGWACKD